MTASSSEQEVWELERASWNYLELGTSLFHVQDVAWPNNEASCFTSLRSESSMLAFFDGPAHWEEVQRTLAVTHGETGHAATAASSDCR